MLNRKRRVRTPGVHMQLGRRYQHTDLLRGQRSPRKRRVAKLLHIGLDAVQERYDAELDREMMQALHDAVVRLVRPEVTALWSDEEARSRSLEIAKGLLEAPLPDA